MAVPKGQRFGGRQKGTPNKATLARAAVIKEEAKASGRMLMLAELDDLYAHHKGLAAKFQPQFGKAKDDNGKEITDKDGKPVLVQIGGDESKSNHHLASAERIALGVLPYQTPRLQSTTLRNDQPDEPLRVQLTIVKSKKRAA